VRKPRWWLAVLAWGVLMVGLALASPLWREFDWWLFARQMQQAPPALQRDLVLLDVPYDDDTGRFRDRLITALEPLATPATAPRALVFDVQFINQTERLPELAAAIDRLRALGTQVFAVLDPLDGPSPDPLYLKRHARMLYEQHLDGSGHTVFEQAAGLTRYEPLFDLGDGQRVPALAARLAEVLFGSPPATDDRPIVVRQGDANALEARTLRFDVATGRTVGPALAGAARDRIVVLGSLERDQPVAGGLSGPAYLVWAISARGLPPEQAEARVAFGPYLLALLVLTTGALAAALSLGFFRRWPGLRSRLGLLACAAAAVPLLLLAVGSTALAATGLLLPQLALPGLGAVLAAALAWGFARRYLLWVAVQPGAEPLDASYDVFISYSRTHPEHIEWVRTQVVEQLLRARRPDGEPLRVFFDTEELRPGDTWIERLYHAIDASRFFVPVYSADYFKKDFCKREIAHALKRQGTDNVFIVPVDEAGVAIPSPYNGVQAVSVRLHPDDFAQRLVDAMTRAWQAEAAAAAPQAVVGVSAAPGTGSTG
jgi:hypothetical protein